MGRLGTAVVILVLALSGVACEAEPDEPATDEEAEPVPSLGMTVEEDSSATPPPAHRSRTVRVAEVLDGDTIRLASGVRVRLVQIDAPESSGECYGEEAGTALRQLLPVGARVRLERDPALDDVDRYDRRLRYVLRGRTNVNLSLVRSGAASVWFFDGDRGRFARELLAGARTAKAQKRGAWGACRARLDPSGAFETHPKLAPAPQAAAGGDCHPSYAGACLDPSVSDYDCAGGGGNGPAFTGRVRVVGHDEYDLDPNGDGVGCETSR